MEFEGRESLRELTVLSRRMNKNIMFSGPENHYEKKRMRGSKQVGESKNFMAYNRSNKGSSVRSQTRPGAYPKSVTPHWYLGTLMSSEEEKEDQKSYFSKILN